MLIVDWDAVGRLPGVFRYLADIALAVGVHESDALLPPDVTFHEVDDAILLPLRPLKILIS